MFTFDRRISHPTTQACAVGAPRRPASTIAREGRSPLNVEADLQVRLSLEYEHEPEQRRENEVTTTFAGEGSLDVSPDSKTIVFRSIDDRGRGITVVCDLPGCTSRRSLRPLPWRLRWTNDGRGIAYLDPGTRSNIWIQPLDGSAPRQLTHFTDGRIIVDYAWSYDGQRLAISRVSITNDIVLFRGLK